MSAESEERPGEGRQPQLGRLARRIAHHGLLVVVLAAPLLIGGAPPWAQVSLSLAMLVVTAAWVVSRRGQAKLPPFGAVAALAVGFTLLQLVPLPTALVAALSPQALELRDGMVGGVPGFVPLTLDVPGTILAALKGFACLGILLVAASATRWRGRTALFVVPLVFGGGAMAMLSFGQRWLGATTILGLYRVTDMPGSGFFGTFVNGNHAASFFTLTGVLAIGCTRETTGPVKLGAGLCGAVCLLGVLSTQSRMGVVGAMAGILSMAVLWLFRRFGRTVALTMSGGLAFLGVPLAVLLALTMRGRLEGKALAATMAEQKVRGWGDALAMTRDFPWTGVGRGAFEGPATAYRANPENVRLVFPENILIQTVSEWGFLVSLLLLALFLLAAIPVIKRISRWEPLYQAAACGLLGVLVHELADFGLEMPGVAFPAALALGLVAGRAQVSSAGEAPALKIAWPLSAAGLALWGVMVGLGLWAAPRTTDADSERADQLIKAKDASAPAQLAAMIRRHPAEHHFELQAARLTIPSRSPEALRHINRAMRLYPTSPWPHLLAAHYLVRVGRRAQAAVEYRLAVELGYSFSHVEALALVGPREVERAVPQRPEELLKLANALLAAGQLRQAESISARAVGLAMDSKPLEGRLELALASGDQAFIRKAAVALASVAQESKAQELAAEGLARSGDLAAARALVQKALVQHPNDGGLMVRVARVLFTAGDVDGAYALVRERSQSQFAVPERIALEMLMADIADKKGTPEVAAAARLRARLLQRVQKTQEASGGEAPGADLPGGR